MVRKLENWVEGFSSLLEPGGIPSIFRTWAAIGTLAGVMERRFWVDVGRGPLYPNMYIVLVAPPGIGKTLLTSQVWHLWQGLSTGTADGLHVAPPSMTAASTIDALHDAERKFYDVNSPLEPMIYNTLNICSNELGTLLPSYDPEMMNRLTDIYDGHTYAERRRTKDLRIEIKKPQINIIAATTPAHLGNALPEGAWDQGFLSRTMIIFNSERVIRPLFEAAPLAKALRDELENDLRHIFNLSGEFSFAEDAAAAISAWHMAEGPPKPEHPRLTNYNTRRTTHLLKLCMVASIASSDKCIVTMEHLQLAMDWLVEAEFFMPDIFKAMTINNDMKAMDECWHFAWTTFLRENQPISEQRIVAFLAERVPVQNVMNMLKVMENQGILKKELVGDVGNAYQPRPRKR